MSNVEVLVSTMRRSDSDVRRLVGDMGVASDAVVVNQDGRHCACEWISGIWRTRAICSADVGLSRSRNLAIANASGVICALADDDMRYADDYVESITAAYEEHTEADIIVFQVERRGGATAKRFRKRPHWETFLSSMRVSSVEITFRRESILATGLRFNEAVGAGTDFTVGEENVFLFDALRRGLRVLYLPIRIASVDCSSSTWFDGYNEKYFRSLGAAYYNMSPTWWPILAVQFLVRKCSLYSSHIGATEAALQMSAGVAAYKRLIGFVPAREQR